jgi:hypothetical protein
MFASAFSPATYEGRRNNGSWPARRIGDAALSVSGIRSGLEGQVVRARLQSCDPVIETRRVRGRLDRLRVSQSGQCLAVLVDLTAYDSQSRRSPGSIRLSPDHAHLGEELLTDGHGLRPEAFWPVALCGIEDGDVIEQTDLQIGQLSPWSWSCELGPASSADASRLPTRQETPDVDAGRLPTHPETPALDHAAQTYRAVNTHSDHAR